MLSISVASSVLRVVISSERLNSVMGKLRCLRSWCRNAWNAEAMRPPVEISGDGPQFAVILSIGRGWGAIRDALDDFGDEPAHPCRLRNAGAACCGDHEAGRGGGGAAIPGHG